MRNFRGRWTASMSRSLPSVDITNHQRALTMLL